MENTHPLLPTGNPVGILSSYCMECAHATLPKKEDGWCIIPKYILLTTCEAVALLGMVISIIEVVFWLGLSLLSKIFSLLIPNSLANVTVLTRECMVRALFASSMLYVLTTIAIYVLLGEQDRLQTVTTKNWRNGEEWETGYMFRGKP